MSHSLNGKTALITGAAQGLGLGIAEAFAKAGAMVILVDRNQAMGEAAAKQLRQQGANALFLYTDLAQPDEIKRLVDSVIEKLGHLDILVNNAAVFLPKPIDQIAVGEWDHLMAVNLRAPFLLVQAALPALLSVRGSVLNIGSTAGLRVFSPNLPYVVAKAGLITMTKSMAQELHAFGIRVNCLCPGMVDTPALHTDVEARSQPADSLDRFQTSGYLTTPAQIASVALYLVSDAASAVTGSILVADAGAMLG
ncbi:MAG: SDR family oxidoreductase [Anaerolineae bacterium]|nr:SDR family oxidoreductase [Anaerolineae bacterium]